MKIKICGIFRDDDIKFVNEALPDYIGFVFAPSRRRVTEERAKDLRGGLNNAICAVGVFVNAAAGLIERLYARGVISAAQLHGGEDARYISDLKARCGVPVIKAVSGCDARAVTDAEDSDADFLLLDGASGGSGKPFDWTLLRGMKKPFFLAGGVGLENIDRAVRVIPRPYAIDVSGGAETGGVKDGEKIMSLVKAVREAAEEVKSKK
jgi:phosphoribosylanthranilate isomerase